MNEDALQQGFKELDELSRAEYRVPLADLVQDSDSQHSAVRVGRLVGVLLKQPFADSQPLLVPSHRTGAYRAWNLADVETFDSRALESSWQRQVLEDIRREMSLEEPHLEHLTLYQFAGEAQYETGFFGFFARTLRKYICRDQDTRKKVDDALKAASESGSKLPPVTPEAIVGAGGLTLGVYLVQAVPILGMVGAPVVAAVVVILYTLGVDAFCQWSASLRTDEDEKH